MKCTFMGAKIAAFFETAKRILLKDVKGFGKVRFTLSRAPSAYPSMPLPHRLHMVSWTGPCGQSSRHRRSL